MQTDVYAENFLAFLLTGPILHPEDSIVLSLGDFVSERLVAGASADLTEDSIRL